MRLGVVGLGRAWETRYQPALAALRDRVEIAAVYDQVARRAEIVARQVGCRAAAGLVDLVDGPDVDAVALLAPQWFGAHPIELAARLGKPVYSALPLPDDEEELARLEALGRDHRPALMVVVLDESAGGALLFDQFDRLARGLDHTGPTWSDALAAAVAAARTRQSSLGDPEITPADPIAESAS